LRLGVDLIMDMVGALPQAYRNSYAEVTTVASLTPQFDGIPSFRALQKAPIQRRVIIIACILTITALATFSYVMEQPISYHHPERNDPKFLIDSALERLNQPRSFDSADNAGSGSGYGPGYGGNTGGWLYRIGGGVSAPVALNTVEAELSDEARRAKYQGFCLIALIVDAQGNPQNPRVIRALGMGPDERALEAVRKYRFKPAMKNGRIPVPVRLTVEVNFRLY
jgi:TonB family protein